MQRCLPALLLALALPLPGAAPASSPSAETPADFATGLPLQLDTDQPLHRVELPLAVHAQARPDLADVRVFNGAGEAVAMAFAAGRAETALAAPPVAVACFPLRDATARGSAALDLRIEQDGRLIALRSDTRTAAAAAWVCDLSAIRAPVQALQLDWTAPAQGFSTRARLEGSDNLEQWTALGGGALLDLRYGGQQLQQRRLAFAPGRHRYLRLEAAGLPALTGARAEPVTATAAAPTQWLEVSGRADPDAAGSVVFDLGAHLDATRLALRLPEANTVVPVEWQVRARQRDDWRSVARSTAWHLRRDGADLEAPALELPGQPGRYWRVRIDARAGIGSGVPTLRLGWTPVQVVFAARGEPPFTLAFGKRDAPPASLPVATLLPGYRAGLEATLPLARTGAPRALGGHAAPAPGEEDAAPADWRRWLLWGVLLLGVAVLGLMARALARRNDNDA